MAMKEGGWVANASSPGNGRRAATVAGFALGLGEGRFAQYQGLRRGSAPLSC